MLKYAFKAIEVILCILVTTHNIPWTRAASMKESYISLESYVRATDPIKHKLPATVAGNSTTLVTFKAFQIIDVDELNQSVKVLCVLMLSWMYPETQWDPSQYNGIQSLRLDTADVWTPSIVVPRRLTSTVLELPDKVDVYYNGRVRALMPGVQEISCFLDLRDFPYDGHNCTIQFVDLTGNNVRPEIDNYGQFATHFITNAEWNFQNQDCGYSQGYLNYTECWFSITRKHVFYVTTLVAPLILMSAMTLLVFCLPAESGEKISFIVSIFVSMTMFLGIINDVIPRNMNRVPRFVILILQTIIVMFLSAAATVFVVKRYHEEQKQKLREIIDKQLHTPSNKSSNKKGAGLVHSTEKRVMGLQSDVANNASSDKGCADWVDEDTKKNKSTLRTSPSTVAWRGSNRISDIYDAKEDVHIENRRNKCICSLTHSQLDRMFFCFFLCLNVVIYTLSLL